MGTALLCIIPSGNLVMGEHEEGGDRRGRHVLNGTVGTAEGHVMAFS